MKRITFTLLLIGCLSCTAQSKKDFQWLIGTWEKQNTRPGSATFESWEFKNGEYFGMGVTTKAKDTVFVEKLRIAKVNGSWNYIADVSQNAQPTYFKITSFTKDGFISENPEHDFPKKIEYQLKDGILTATISAGNKKIPFVFKKTDE